MTTATTTQSRLIGIERCGSVWLEKREVVTTSAAHGLMEAKACENAQLESARIEMKKREEREKLAQFERNMKRRLKEFNSNTKRSGDANETNETSSPSSTSRIVSVRKQYCLMSRDLAREQHQKQLQQQHRQKLRKMQLQQQLNKKEKPTAAATEEERNETLTSVRDGLRVMSLAADEVEDRHVKSIKSKHPAKSISKTKNKDVDDDDDDYYDASYISYLKQVLREKCALLKVSVPPLCQCNVSKGSSSSNSRSSGERSSSVWDKDWNACANNCVFYNNPKG